MIQGIIVGLIFIAAVVYIGRLLFKSFRGKTGCASGCGKCGAIDFKKIEKQLSREKV